MATITINVEDIDNAANACREVSELIEQGYYSGTIGYSGDTWKLDKDE